MDCMHIQALLLEHFDICNCAGLHPFSRPQMPADLGQGYPEQYTKKAEDAPVNVEPVAQAVIRVRLMPSNSLLVLVVLWLI